MKLVFALICDRAAISSTTGKLDMIGVFQAIGSPSFPAVHPNMAMVLGLEVPSVDFDRDRNIRIPLLGPSGKEVAVVHGKIRISVPEQEKPKPPVLIHNQIIQLPNVVFPTPGDYAFHVMIQEDQKATIPLVLTLIEEPA